MLQLLLTPEEAARSLRIGRTRLYELLRTGRLPSIKLGGSRRITPAALLAYVESITTPPPGDRVSTAGGSLVAPPRRAGAKRTTPPTTTPGTMQVSEAERLPFPPLSDTTEGP